MPFSLPPLGEWRAQPSAPRRPRLWSFLLTPRGWRRRIVTHATNRVRHVLALLASAPNDGNHIEFADDVGLSLHVDDSNIRWPTGFGRLSGGSTMPYTLPKDTWHCIELSIDGQTRVQKLYVNRNELINATGFPAAALKKRLVLSGGVGEGPPDCPCTAALVGGRSELELAHAVSSTSIASVSASRLNVLCLFTNPPSAANVAKFSCASQEGLAAAQELKGKFRITASDITSNNESSQSMVIKRLRVPRGPS